MRTRTLVLKRETLTALTGEDMAAVVGGSHLCTVTHGASFDASCPTTPINYCLDDVTNRSCLTISPDVCVWTR